jgi:acyl-CoA thioester hydrolase
MTSPSNPSDKSDPSAAPAADAACRIEFRVRYAEVDQMGAVHHSRYWVYFEMGRTELLRQQGVAYADLEREGVFFVVAKCSAKFLAPARYDDLLALTTRIVRMGAARIDHEYELHRVANGQLLCTAQTTLACLDRAGRIAAIPDSIRGPDEGQTGGLDAGQQQGQAQS